MNNIEKIKQESSDNNDIKRLSKDSLTYGIAVIIPALIGIASIYIYTHIFSVEQYGEYNQIFNTTLLITTLFSQWIQQSIQRYRPLYRKNGDLKKFDENLINLLFCMLVLIVAIGGLIGGFKDILGRYERYYWVCILLICTQFTFLILGAILQSDFKVKTYKNYNILTSALKFSIGLLLIFYIEKNPINIVNGLILGQLLLLGFMFQSTGLSLRRFNPKRIYETFEFMKMFVIYGFPMIGWFIGNSILNLADRYMLEGLASLKDVGIYSANYSIVSASLGLLTTPLLTAAHPIIMNKAGKSPDNEIQNIISFFSRIYLIISLPLLVIVFVFHQEVTQLFLGKAYREGSIIIPILFLGSILWNLGMYGHKGYEIKEKTQIMLGFVIICAIVNVFLNLIFIPAYGYKGASIATLISMSIYPILIYIFSYRYIKWKLAFISLIKVLMCCSIVYLSLEVFKSIYTSNSFIQLLAGGVIGVIVYMLSLLLSKEIDYEVVKKIKTKIF
ncbi:oligosaccharide flippase family protein [Priestia megaterium]|uniref:oligosaccharide flippase family protein n=1 Tax=Priestia megaterium TaxID=1404 RepID=UPI002452858F|nr:polysaccharide biosynthesis C-terminal domain-containing protein [Priestia megaterium]MDH3159700.1 polysaccharide biosynthesis C-terminal domain-containing protein [Priestia megaterium]MED4113705.1 polysaccharide biosynthesis C-terminal domain-containing protein [Priestia megaterium]